MKTVAALMFLATCAWLSLGFAHKACPDDPARELGSTLCKAHAPNTPMARAIVTPNTRCHAPHVADCPASARV